jgi:hypothetical protein
MEVSEMSVDPTSAQPVDPNSAPVQGAQAASAQPSNKIPNSNLDGSTLVANSMSAFDSNPELKKVMSMAIANNILVKMQKDAREWKEMMQKIRRDDEQKKR